MVRPRRAGAAYRNRINNGTQVAPENENENENANANANASPTAEGNVNTPSPGEGSTSLSNIMSEMANLRS